MTQWLANVCRVAWYHVKDRSPDSATAVARAPPEGMRPWAVVASEWLAVAFEATARWSWQIIAE
jgi:hypothetical protein